MISYIMQSLVISFQITFMGADSTISSGKDTFLVNLIYVNTDHLNSPTKEKTSTYSHIAIPGVMPDVPKRIIVNSSCVGIESSSC